MGFSNLVNTFRYYRGGFPFENFTKTRRRSDDDSQRPPFREEFLQHIFFICFICKIEALSFLALSLAVPKQCILCVHIMYFIFVWAQISMSG